MTVASHFGVCFTHNVNIRLLFASCFFLSVLSIIKGAHVGLASKRMLVIIRNNLLQMMIKFNTVLMEDCFSHRITGLRASMRASTKCTEGELARRVLTGLTEVMI